MRTVSYTHLDVYKRQLHWGTCPVLFQTVKDNVYGAAITAAKDKGYIKAGDLAIITAGLPLGCLLYTSASTSRQPSFA